MSEEVDLKPMEFDVDAVEVPVTIRRGNKEEKYVLRDATGGAATTWRSHCGQNVIYTSDGKPSGMKGGMAEAEPLLVSLCLFTVKEGLAKEKWPAVPIGQVKSWPSKVQKELFRKAKEISALNETPESIPEMEAEIARLQRLIATIRAQEAAVKNSQGSTTDGGISADTSDSLSGNASNE